MALTPFRVVTLLASTLVFSIIGIVLVVAGVHGPEATAWVGALLLLPNIILMQLGVPIAIPFMQHPLCACFSGVAGWLLLRTIPAHSLCCWPYSAQDTGIIRPELPATARALPAEKCYNSFPNRRQEERV